MDQVETQKPQRYLLFVRWSWMFLAPFLWATSFYRLYTHEAGEQLGHGFGILDSISLVLLPIIFIVDLLGLVKSRKRAVRG